MTLKQLQYLLGVVDNGLNITSAADRLFTSQPGISKRLKQLEQEIGVRIFTRKGKSLVALTPAGQSIVQYARQISRDVENIRSLGKDLVAEQEGTLSIATTHTQARYVLPEILSQFHERYPKVSLELHQGTAEQIAALVAENRVDFAIATESHDLFPELNLLPCYDWRRLPHAGETRGASPRYLCVQFEPRIVVPEGICETGSRTASRIHGARCGRHQNLRAHGHGRRRHRSDGTALR